MIMLNANKQEMKYSVFLGTQDIVTPGESETWTNPLTGETVTLDNTTGDSKPSYSEATTFYANIALGQNRDEYEAYGFSNGDYSGVISAIREEFPINVGSLIWFESEVAYIDDEIDPKSADYTVIGIVPTINEVKYLIKGVV